MTDAMTIIYDGKCPFCSSYLSMLRLREAVGRVEMVDARSDDPRVAQAVARGHDLDRGMVVIWQGRQFFGADALHLLATLSAPDGARNALTRRLFASARLAAFFYPLMSGSRRLYLRLSGTGLIGAGRKDATRRE